MDARLNEAGPSVRRRIQVSRTWTRHRLRKGENLSRQVACRRAFLQVVLGGVFQNELIA